MTVQTINGIVNPIAYSMVASDKGDITNRAQCAYEQCKNSVAASAKTAATIGAAGFAGYGITHSEMLTKYAHKAFNKMADYCAKLVKFISKSPNIDKCLKTMKKLPASAKVAAMLALPTMIALSWITNIANYKSGQIDQKYTDKAVFENKLKQIL